MAWTKLSNDKWVNVNETGAKSWTKLSDTIWVSDSGKTVTKVGDFVVTDGGTEPECDIDFPGEF